MDHTMAASVLKRGSDLLGILGSTRDLEQVARLSTTLDIPKGVACVDHTKADAGAASSWSSRAGTVDVTRDGKSLAKLGHHARLLPKGRDLGCSMAAPVPRIRGHGRHPGHHRGRRAAMTSTPCSSSVPGLPTADHDGPGPAPAGEDRTASRLTGHSPFECIQPMGCRQRRLAYFSTSTTRSRVPETHRHGPDRLIRASTEPGQSGRHPMGCTALQMQRSSAGVAQPGRQCR